MLILNTSALQMRMDKGRRFFFAPMLNGWYRMQLISYMRLCQTNGTNNRTTIILYQTKSVQPLGLNTFCLLCLQADYFISSMLRFTKLLSASPVSMLFCNRVMSMS